MPVLALILLFHAGQLAGAKIIGPAPNVTACHQGLAAIVKANSAKIEAAGLQAFGLCIDTTPFSQHLQVQPAEPMKKNPADPLSNESFQQTTTL